MAYFAIHPSSIVYTTYLVGTQGAGGNLSFVHVI